MRSKLLPLAVFSVAVTALGIAAVSVANAVSTKPAPTPVIRHQPVQPAGLERRGAVDPVTTTTVNQPNTSTTLVDHGGDRTVTVTNDGPSHDGGDDHGGDRTGSISDVEDGADDRSGPSENSGSASGGDDDATVDDSSGHGSGGNDAVADDQGDD